MLYEVITRTKDDLPVPRLPHQRTLLAGKPLRNWRVFSSTTAFYGELIMCATLDETAEDFV